LRLFGPWGELQGDMEKNLDIQMAENQLRQFRLLLLWGISADIVKSKVRRFRASRFELASLNAWEIKECHPKQQAIFSKPKKNI
jgi:hypothetical protein